MVVFLEADLSSNISYHFSDYIHFYEKHVHKTHAAESRQKLRNRQAEFQTITLKSCFCKYMFYKTRKKMELASITCLIKPEHSLS